MDIKKTVCDFETRSFADLKKVGAYNYSLHSSTRATCFAFKARNDKLFLLKFEEIGKYWRDLNEGIKYEWRRYIENGYLFVAHNSGFERAIYENVLVRRFEWPAISPERWRCTAAKAAACALPRSLEGAGTAMQLPIQKDKGGMIAMMRTCRPTKEWNAWAKRGGIGTAEPAMFLSPREAPEVFEALYHYCKLDVLTEEKLDEALPDLIESEQRVWHLNQLINFRGVKIDLPTVKKIVGIMEIESKTKLKELDSLTMGLVTKPGARKSILDFLKLEGIELPDIRAKTVEDALKNNKIDGDCRRLLEIRKALSKTSTKKYQTFIDRCGRDNRVRDILMYHGASTGRDSGTGVQPQNFPKPVINISKEKPYAPIQNVIECDAEMLKILYGDNLSLLFSSLLRNMIIPSKGHELFVADFSKIEVAVLWWLADNTPGLKILHEGKDPYIYMAMKNTGKKYDEITDEERQLGKAQILGAGFRMGWKRFRDAAFEMYRLKLTNRQSFDAIKSYRKANEAVVKLWDDYENSSIEVTENGRCKYDIGKCDFLYDYKLGLRVRLPSGRFLTYLKPETVYRTMTFTTLETDSKGNEIEVEKTSAPKKTLQHLGLALNKKDMVTEFKHGGILTENIVQAVARDLMVEAALRLEKAGYKILLTVHDEIIAERPIGEGSVEEFSRIMCEKPTWADSNLPIGVSAWRGERYRK